LVNIVLLARDVFEGAVDPTVAVLAVSSTLLYALGAIAIAARIFGTDALLYGSEGGWGDLFSRPASQRNAASVAVAGFCVVLLFPCCVLLAGYLRLQLQLGFSSRLLLNALALAVLFVGVPLTAAVVQRVRLTAGFRLSWPGLSPMLAAIILGLSAWPWAHTVFLLNERIGLTSLTSQHFEMVEAMLEQFRHVPLALILFSMAVVPAVCEELFFRGYLFRALEHTASAGRAIWVSALIFGIFHVVSSGQATPERFLPSTFLGFILGWVAWKSGSVWPGIMLHACHNGLMLCLAYYRDEVGQWGWVAEQQTGLPGSWLIISACGLAIGGGLIRLVSSLRARRMPV
jgi:ABC-2 type transport system permease protein/sodium transport system permease protein